MGRRLCEKQLAADSIFGSRGQPAASRPSPAPSPASLPFHVSEQRRVPPGSRQTGIMPLGRARGPGSKNQVLAHSRSRPGSSLPEPYLSQALALHPKASPLGARSPPAASMGKCARGVFEGCLRAAPRALSRGCGHCVGPFSTRKGPPRRPLGRPSTADGSVGLPREGGGHCCLPACLPASRGPASLA